VSWATVNLKEAGGKRSSLRTETDRIAGEADSRQAKAKTDPKLSEQRSKWPKNASDPSVSGKWYDAIPEGFPTVDHDRKQKLRNL